MLNSHVGKGRRLEVNPAGRVDRGELGGGRDEDLLRGERGVRVVGGVEELGEAVARKGLGVGNGDGARTNRTAREQRARAGEQTKRAKRSLLGEGVGSSGGGFSDWTSMCAATVVGRQ